MNGCQNGFVRVPERREGQRLESRADETRHGLAAGLFGLRWKAAITLAGAALLAVLVAASLLGPPGASSGPGPSDAGDRIKGLEPSPLLFRKTADGSEPLEDGATVRQGDLIRIGYRSAGQTYGLILSIDGRGVVTHHLPREGGQPAPLSSASRALLDDAYELDDAPRWERFYFVTGSAPFDAGPIVAAALRVAASASGSLPAELPLETHVRQSSVLLVKEAAGTETGGYRLHVRGLDSCASRVIEDARTRSATVRRLQDALGASDVVAYVQCAWRQPGEPQGMLVWLSRSLEHRFVVIRLALKEAPGRRMELLGHELQHALEVADAAWVTDESAMSRLFARVGLKTTWRETFETAAAKDAELQVRRDLSRPSSGLDADSDTTLAMVLPSAASNALPIKR